MSKITLPRESSVEFDPALNMWDKQPFESQQAYNAFQVYLSLGDERTFIDAYRQKHPEAKRMDGRWNQWARDYRWKERGLAYDGDLAEKAKRQREKQFFTDMREMKDRQLKLARGAVQTSIGMLQQVNQDLKELQEMRQRRLERIASLKLQVEDTRLTEEQRGRAEHRLEKLLSETIIPIAQIPNFARTALAAAEIATAAEANALGVDDLMHKLYEAAQEMAETTADQPPQEMKQVGPIVN